MTILGYIGVVWDEAEREGRGYRTAINQALRNYIKQDKRPIQEIYERRYEGSSRT